MAFSTRALQLQTTACAPLRLADGLVTWTLTPCVIPAAAQNPGLALALQARIARLLRDDAHAFAIGRYLRRCGLVPVAPDPRELPSIVAALVQRGHLTATPGPAIVVDASAPAERLHDPVDDDALDELPPTPETWIGVEIVDDEGRPIQDVDLVLELPDGTIVRRDDCPGCHREDRLRREGICDVIVRSAALESNAA